MRIAYVNANYQKNHTGGGHVHMGQFIKNAVALGHEIWVYPGNQYPGVKVIPTDRIGHIKTMREMDALYTRLEGGFPKIGTWSLPPRRWLYGFNLVIWEFNTIPEDALFRGLSREWINTTVKNFRHYGQGCDLAISVAPKAAKYSEETLGISNNLVIYNGSDPKLFNPDASSVKRMVPYKDSINVVWIGSAKIKYHDFDLLQESAEILWNQNKSLPIVFHIIGPELSCIMADMPPNVFYWGAETYQRVPNWLSAMDIGLYITKGGYSTYGSPLKVFDYLASALTVVSTTHPAVLELFEQLNQTELMVPTGDAPALAEVLIKLSQDRDRVKQLGMAGRQLVIEKYNWRRAVKDTMDAIEALMKEKGLTPKP